MKDWQFKVSLVLAAACLVLAILVVRTGKSAQKLQTELQQQQNEINSGLLGQTGQQLGSSILRDMATVALNDQRMLKLLAENGYSIQVNQPTNAPVKSMRKEP